MGQTKSSQSILRSYSLHMGQQTTWLDAASGFDVCVRRQRLFILRCFHLDADDFASGRRQILNDARCCGREVSAYAKLGLRKLPARTV